MIINNRKITISPGGSRKSTFWQGQEVFWSEFAEKLKTPQRSPESLMEYLRLPKMKQDELKDVGGFVGGALKEGKRKATHVTGRDLITLDLDNLPQNSTTNVLQRVDALGCSYAVYSTRKHEAFKPRLRVIVPLDRTVMAEEYEPIARKLAEKIGMEFCDPTTFEASRLMYWPSCSGDSEYVYQVGDKNFCSSDGILGLYPNWQDIKSWPQIPGHDPIHERTLSKQQNPEEKQGIVGAFCRVFDVYQVMEELLPGIYEMVDGMEERYSFYEGSTIGGAVVYENGNFLYSHHATDPCGGRLVNAFDLFRIHQFGHLDEEAKENTPVNKLPSYSAACAWAFQKEEIAALLAKEQHEKALSAFDGIAEVSGNAEDYLWATQLKKDNLNQYLKTIDNICIILKNDPCLKGKIAYDEFAVRGLVSGAFPWNPGIEERDWTEVDDAGVMWYLEKAYNITGREKIMSALMLVSAENTLNPVQEYIKEVKWDGIQRLDTMFIDYLGAKDTLYTRTVTRKAVVAMIARAMTPGVKHDEMTVLTGPQGIGKSTMLSILGNKWYSDSLTDFGGKEAAELIQGKWVNEVSEMQAMSKSTTNAVKQFLSKQNDIYREPYGRRTKSYPRRGVFFGTTNDFEFLKDLTGNRRFNPIDVYVNPPTKDVFKGFEKEVRQIIAEAYVRWQLGETLYLPKELEEAAKAERDVHQEQNAKEGLILEFIERPIPKNWQSFSTSQRRVYWGNQQREDVETVERDRVCALEIWCECLNGDPKNLRKIDAAEINGLLNRFPDWERNRTSGRFGPYGLQRGFIKRNE